MAVESGEIDYRPQISCLLWDQEQLVVVPYGCHVGDPLYGSLQQQGIHGLMEVLTVVSGPEADALMGELRSLLECTAQPVLDNINAGGPAVAQPGLDIKHLVYMPIGHMVLKIYVPWKSFHVPSQYCTSPVKFMYTAGKISTCPH